MLPINTGYPNAVYVGTGEKEVRAIRDETEKLIVDGLENKLLSVLQDLLSSTYPENMVSSYYYIPI